MELGGVGRQCHGLDLLGVEPVGAEMLKRDGNLFIQLQQLGDSIGEVLVNRGGDGTEESIDPSFVIGHDYARMSRWTITRGWFLSAIRHDPFPKQVVRRSSLDIDRDIVDLGFSRILELLSLNSRGVGDQLIGFQRSAEQRRIVCPVDDFELVAKVLDEVRRDIVCLPDTI